MAREIAQSVKCKLQHLSCTHVEPGRVVPSWNPSAGGSLELLLSQPNQIGELHVWWDHDSKNKVERNVGLLSTHTCAHANEHIHTHRIGFVLLKFLKNEWSIFISPCAEKHHYNLLKSIWSTIEKMGRSRKAIEQSSWEGKWVREDSMRKRTQVI